MNPTAYLVTCDRYAPSVCLPGSLESEKLDRDNPKVEPLFTCAQIGESIMAISPLSGLHGEGNAERDGNG